MPSSSSSDEERKSKKKKNSEKEKSKQESKKEKSKDESKKPTKRRVDSDSSSDEGVEDATPVKKSKAGGNRIKNEDGEEMIELGSMRYVTVRNFRGKALVDIREYYTDKTTGALRPGKKGISLSREQYENFKAVMSEERNRAVDSPLGHLDPSRITNMVVDQVFPTGSAVHPDNDGFVVPDPPHQQWPRSSPVASPSVMSSPSRAMDGGQSRMGTPTNLMHMQQGAIGSPANCIAPMTPQQMVQQQQSGMIQGQPTPTGQFDQSKGFNPQQQQMSQGYSQVVPESPGALHMQQQMVAAGVAGQDDGIAANGHD
ncbi:hypothetical protein GCK32_013372, partial [Trichostrongylus colubriformis]